MRHGPIPASTLLAAGATLAFAVGAIAASLFLQSPKRRAAPSESRADAPGSNAAALACVERHPDPMISDRLARAFRDGRVRLEIGPLPETVLGTFEVAEGVPKITISSELLPESASSDACAPFLSTLTHEHVHYRQSFHEPWKDLARRIASGERLDDDDCWKLVMEETEAYGLTCVAGLRYGWEEARRQCASVDASSNAERMLRKRSEAYPECRAVWSALAGTATIETHAPRKRAPTRRTRAEGPIYLPPP